MQIDAGRQVVTWAQLAGHGIIDVNIIAKPTTLDVIVSLLRILDQTFPFACLISVRHAESATVG